MITTWSYRTELGRLRIAPSRSRDGRFELWLEDVPIGSYHRPEAAADDVYHAVTGGPDGLDDLLSKSAPRDLSEWNRHERR